MRIGGNSILDLQIFIQNNHLEATIHSKIINFWFYLQEFYLVMSNLLEVVQLKLLRCLHVKCVRQWRILNIISKYMAYMGHSTTFVKLNLTKFLK